jgi:hypothetical protein
MSLKQEKQETVFRVSFKNMQKCVYVEVIIAHTN